MARRVEIITISLPGELLRALDQYMREHGCTNRSALIREAIRKMLNIEEPDGRDHEGQEEPWSEDLAVSLAWLYLG